MPMTQQAKKIVILTAGVVRLGQCGGICGKNKRMTADFL
jgi:hypothetical protein